MFGLPRPTQLSRALSKECEYFAWTVCVCCEVKGYLRKGASLMAIKEYSRAAEVYQKAIDLDANCQEAIDAYRT